MRLASIKLRGKTSIEFPVINTSSFDPYILKSAEGLGPPEMNVFISQSPGMDGYYKGREAQYREIVLSIDLNPDYRSNLTVSDLRSDLYGLLSSGLTNSIEIILVDDMGVDIMFTTGYIKKMEVVPFSATPEVQITMACTKAYFEAIESFYPPLISETHQQSIENIGNAETGFVLTATCPYNTVQYDLMDNHTRKIFLNFEFLANDILTIDSRVGSRSITLERDGGTENLIHALSMDSEWVTLYQGSNYLRSYSGFLWDSLFYVPRYWGV